MAHPLLDRPAWIFDMDGTLTVPVHDFAALRAQLGIPATDDILGHIEAAAPERQRALRAAVHAWEEGLAAAAVAQEDALALLDALAARGARLGVLTRNTRSTALRTLRAAGMGERFAEDDVLGRDEAPAKPAPDGVQALLAAWGLAPDQAVMVGDYVFDAWAGRAAGAATVLVLRADDRGWEAEADLLVNDLRALLA